jgi:hypothetical protein
MLAAKGRENLGRSQVAGFAARIGQKHDRPEDSTYQFSDYHHGDDNNIDHDLHRRPPSRNGKMTAELQGVDRRTIHRR